jgi:hypothetical protein
MGDALAIQRGTAVRTGSDPCTVARAVSLPAGVSPSHAGLRFFVVNKAQRFRPLLQPEKSSFHAKAQRRKDFSISEQCDAVHLSGEALALLKILFSLCSWRLCVSQSPDLGSTDHRPPTTDH